MVAATLGQRAEQEDGESTMLKGDTHVLLEISPLLNIASLMVPGEVHTIPLGPLCLVPSGVTDTHQASQAIKSWITPHSNVS